MAQPPGKKNAPSTCSQGEKGATAIALVFAIFQLNPPFCCLDEVDAPLRDANNGALCAKLVNEMAKSTQFLFISHNRTPWRWPAADRRDDAEQGGRGRDRRHARRDPARPKPPSAPPAMAR